MPFLLAQVASSFIAPALAAAGIGAVAIPIAIHLLSRLRTRNEPWAAMRFLLEAYRRHRRRLRFEQLLLLLVRCLVVAIAGLALAGPLLTGCVGGWAGGLSPQQRTVHLVLDDTLTSRVAGIDGRSRFERLREQGLALVDAAGPEDRLVLWRAATPVIGPVEGREDVRRALAEAEPRYTASRWVEVLQTIHEEMLPGADTAVVVLTDASRSVMGLDRSIPPELAGLGERAAVHVTRPAPDAANVQVESFAPRRRVVFAEQPDAAPVLPVELSLRRFDGATEARDVEVTVAEVGPDGQRVALTTRRVRWAVGQAVTRMNLDLTLSTDGGLDRTLVLVATIETGDGTATITADDERFTAVDLRQRMSVALVAESLGTSTQVTPARWLNLALSPRMENGVIETRAMLPADVNTAGLASVDAVLLTRPDLLSDAAWDDLASFTGSGGVVWVFTPAGDTAAVWARSMGDVFDLPWRMGIEPVARGDGGAWSLDTDWPAPPALSRLGADWESLLRPVRVARRLELGVEDDQTWLAVVGSGDGVTSAEALMVGRRIGGGALLFLATAIDGDWTNLPTKPLFVPLVHETLRGLLGDTSVDAGTALTGQTPTLDHAWLGTGRLIAVSPEEGEAPATIALRRGEDGMVAAESITMPGVYRGDGDTVRLLPVNVPADAGDSRTYSEQQLGQWLDAMGPWSFLDGGDAGVALARDQAVTNLGWPLLVVLLVLVVLEMVLARTTSHAQVPTRAGLGTRLARVVRHLRHEPDDESGVQRGEAA